MSHAPHQKNAIKLSSKMEPVCSSNCHPPTQIQIQQLIPFPPDRQPVGPFLLCILIVKVYSPKLMSLLFSVL